MAADCPEALTWWFPAAPLPPAQASYSLIGKGYANLGVRSRLPRSPALGRRTFFSGGAVASGLSSLCPCLLCSA
jgi:hypothetical protein